MRNIDYNSLSEESKNELRCWLLGQAIVVGAVFGLLILYMIIQTIWQLWEFFT